MSLFIDNPPVSHSTVDRIVERARAAGMGGEQLAALDSALRRSVPPREPGDDGEEETEADDGELVMVGDVLAGFRKRGNGDGTGRGKLAAVVDAGE